MNNNYYRIAAYHPEKNISVIADSNGKFEKLWQFSSYFVCKGFKIISVSSDEQFTCGNIPKTDADTAHVLIRACCKGKPTISGSFIEIQDKMYQPQSD